MSIKVCEMHNFLKEAIVKKDKKWVTERLFKLYLLYNKAMNLITKLGLTNDFLKGLDPELVEELNISGDFLQKAWNIKNNQKEE